MIRPALLTALLPLLAACQSRPAATPDPAPITDRAWILRELEGEPLDSAALAKPPTLTLATAETRASGFAGCNRFSGPYTLGPGTLEFGPLAMTRMACPEMNLESHLSTALSRVRQYRLDGAALLLEAEGTVLARFEPAPDSAR